MSGAKALLDVARSGIGTGEPNKYQTWYEAKVGYNLGGNWPWCDAFVSYCAYHSDNEAYVCPKGPRAYTVYHAQDGRDVVGTWHAGTVENIKEYAKPGAIIFFDWSGSNNISAIDHVGIVEKNLGDGRVVAIEGNSNDVCARRVRGASVLAGFFMPKYPAAKPKPAPKPPAKSTLIVPDGSPQLHLGSTGRDVYNLQKCLNRVANSKLETDGIYGKLTARQVDLFKGKHGLTKDGRYGTQTAAKLKTAVKAS